MQKSMQYTDIKTLLTDIAKYAKTIDAYILPADTFKELKFVCEYTGQIWFIDKKDYESSKTIKSRFIIENERMKSYYCRAVSCKMFEQFNKELEAYIRYLKWYRTLSDKERSYISSIHRVSDLTDKFGTLELD